MDILDISEVQLLVSAGQILWTEHVAMRIRERKIKRIDVIACIQNGEIIEHYPNDTPFPSGLIFGTCLAGKPLHVVCSLSPGVACCVITAYFPSPEKWEADNRTRKDGK